VTWVEIKDVLEHYSGLHRDALHIYFAAVIQILAAAVSRRGLRHPLPWLFVLLLAIANEIFDVYSDGKREAWEVTAALHDLWNTMLMPTLLFMVARFAPGLVARRPEPRAVAPDEAA
jgi:hypothetical protein